ncbi:hypothetical protein [Micromonospora zhanjiangensis]|uniref:Uncharacterized protein n=1 Tax=Micromonospora zhanjiangensis TaxID=1522057 RepID=A0ABV8KXE4_9ACTN
MAARWKWYLRPGQVAIDLTGQAAPDEDAPGRLRRRTVEDVVPTDRPPPYRPGTGGEPEPPP